MKDELYSTPSTRVVNINYETPLDSKVKFKSYTLANYWMDLLCDNAGGVLVSMWWAVSDASGGATAKEEVDKIEKKLIRRLDWNNKYKVVSIKVPFRKVCQKDSLKRFCSKSLLNFDRLENECLLHIHSTSSISHVIQRFLCICSWKDWNRLIPQPQYFVILD